MGLMKGVKDVMIKLRVNKNKRALSQVVTTLIILVVAVLLAAVVVFYAINVVSTRVQDESLSLTIEHIWVNSSATVGTPSYTVAGLMVENTGGRDVVLQNIAVRGQQCPWNSTTDPTNQKFVLYCTLNASIQSDLVYVPNFNYTGDPNNVVISGTQYNFTVANNDLVLKSGDTMLVYIVNPDSIRVNDVGITTSIAVHTADAVYYTEVNIEAVASS
jgi:hypothetical protein